MTTKTEPTLKRKTLRFTAAMLAGALLMWANFALPGEAHAAEPAPGDSSSVGVQSYPDPGKGKVPNKTKRLPGKKCEHAYNPYGGYMSSQCMAGFGGKKMTKRDVRIIKCINAVLISGAAVLGGGGASARSVYAAMGGSGATCALT